MVVDFTGEMPTLTAKHRRKSLGHKVVILDPFKVVTKTPDTLNPLDCIVDLSGDSWEAHQEKAGDCEPKEETPGGHPSNGCGEGHVHS